MNKIEFAYVMIGWTVGMILGCVISVGVMIIGCIIGVGVIALAM